MTHVNGQLSRYIGFKQMNLSYKGKVFEKHIRVAPPSDPTFGQPRAQRQTRVLRTFQNEEATPKGNEICASENPRAS